METSRECIYCNTRFTAKMGRRVFCSDRCRARYNRESKNSCFYCGVLADTKDHITPQSVRAHANFETVQCCRECNSLLGAAEPFDLEWRVLTLIQRTESRYQLDKPVPEWSDDEIEELGHTLKTAVRGKIYQRQRAIERVLHMKAVLINLGPH